MEGLDRFSSWKNPGRGAIVADSSPSRPACIEIRLDVLDGVLPANCFAVLRIDGGAGIPYGGSVNLPVACTPQKVTSVGQAPLGAGPVSVDIFQKIGSIPLGIAQPDVQKVAPVDWPGVQGAGAGTLKFRITTVGFTPPEQEVRAESQSPTSHGGTMGLRELRDMIAKKVQPGGMTLSELRNRDGNSHSDPRRPDRAGIIGSPSATINQRDPTSTWHSGVPVRRPTLTELDFNAKPRPRTDPKPGPGSMSRSRTASKGPLSPENSVSPPPDQPGMSLAKTLPVLKLDQREDEPRAPVYRVITLNNANQIIPHLYLGGVQSVADPNNLIEQGIRAVCCCMRPTEFPEADLSPNIEYYRVDVEDISREPIELFWEEATEFIHSWITRDQPVLVHCRAGVSRSASTVMAYLVTYHGYSLRDAFFVTRKSRSFATPNVGFMEKLITWEEKTGGEATVCLDKYISWFNAVDPPAVPDLAPE